MSGYVYIIFTEGDPFSVKIGFSRNPEQRMRALQGACPCQLKLAAVAPGDVALEQRLHQTFAQLSAHGEWFHGEGKLRNFVWYLLGFADGKRQLSREEFEIALSDILLNGKCHPDDPMMDDEYEASGNVELWPEFVR